MYRPSYFREDRLEILHRLDPGASAGAAGGRQATQGCRPTRCPCWSIRRLRPTARCAVTWRGRKRSDRGIARLRAGALVIFQGPQAYVSPSWYPSKAEHGKVVPTWNYVAVHAWGTPRVIDDAAWLRRLIEGPDREPRAGPARALGGRRCAGGLHRDDGRRHRRHRNPDRPDRG